MSALSITWASRWGSTIAGVGAGAFAIVVAAQYVEGWAAESVLRDYQSAVGFFYWVTLWAIVGAIEIVAALSPTGNRRATAMTAASLILVFAGLGAGAAFDMIGVRFFRVGILAAVAAVLALAGIGPRLVAGLWGVAAAIPALVFIYVTHAVVAALLP